MRISFSDGKAGGQKPERPGVEVGDRNFGCNYTTLSQLTDEGVNFVVRMKDAAQTEVNLRRRGLGMKAILNRRSRFSASPRRRR